MIIRKASIDDLDILTNVENECFPITEAASREVIKERLKYFAHRFWLLFEGETLISFIDGMATNQKDLADEMYEKARLHEDNGEWQMIFGVNTIPSYRKQGYARKLMGHVIEEVKRENKKGLVLTCKKELIPFYEKFGYKSEGISASVHGNVVWYQMRLIFEEER